MTHFLDQKWSFLDPLQKVRFFDFFKNFTEGVQFFHFFSFFFSFCYFLKSSKRVKGWSTKRGHFRALFWAQKWVVFRFFKNAFTEQSTCFRTQKVESVLDQFWKKTDFFVFLTTFFHFLNFQYTLFRPFLLNNVLIYESVIFTILSDFPSKFCHFLIHFWISSGNSLFFTIFGSFLDTFLKFVHDSIRCKI